MKSAKPGECMDRAPLVPEVDFSQFRARISTEGYASPEYQERERELLWMRVWQIAGRADDLPEAGDWKVHKIFDQSYVLVRGKDGVIRGFVNACRHRGNRLCSGKGHSNLFLCKYHNWSYGLDGKLLAVARPDFDSTIAEFVGPEDELGLLKVSVECFAGFIFLNPDPNAPPLSEFLGEAADILAPYHIEDMVPVGLNVRESLNCNWKVVMDAFGEGYHVQAVHPEIVGLSDLTKERFVRLGDHCFSTVPFGEPGAAESGPEREIESYLKVPTELYPNFVEVLPRFAKLVDAYRRKDGSLDFPDGVGARPLMQQAIRDTLTARGLDVSGLTDRQVIDYQYWLFFPNVFIQLCAGETTIIIAEPHPDGDPNRCVWRVTYLQWLPPEQRKARRADVLEIPEGEHFQYPSALEQDYEQMEIQQDGLRNKALKYLALTRQEPRVANLHTALDRWVD